MFLKNLVIFWWSKNSNMTEKFLKIIYCKMISQNLINLLLIIFMIDIPAKNQKNISVIFQNPINQ